MRPVNSHRETVNIFIYKKYRMGIPHRNTGSLENQIIDPERIINYRGCGFEGNRNFVCLKHGLSHSNPDQVSDTFRPLYSGSSFDFQDILGRNFPVPYIFGKAAYTVSAHLDLAAVGIEYNHFKISLRGATQQQKLVRANTESPVAQRPGKTSHIEMTGQIYIPAVNNDKVIARTVHLCKNKFHN